MTLDGSLRILGALGPGPGAPLIAQVDGPPSGPVVLADPAPAAVAAAVRALGHPQVVPELFVLRAEARSFGVSPWIGGEDLHDLLARVRGALPGTPALAIIRGVAVVLRELHSAGLAHGRLRPSTIRLAVSGVPYLVGSRGGDPADDLAALRSVLEHLVGADERSPTGAAQQVLERWASSAGALITLIDEVASFDPVRELLALAPLTGQPRIIDHPLTGRVFGGSAPPKAPPKVRVALIAGLTLALGVGSGWFLAAAPPRAPELVVPGATEVRLDCDPLVRTGPRLPLDLSAVCRVTAAFEGRPAAEGDLQGPLSGRYACIPNDGVLECDGS